MNLPDVQLPHRFYLIWWSAWVLWFIIGEVLALMDPDKKDTFSEQIWFLMFHDGRPRPVLFYVIAGFFIWVLMHFLFRGRFG